MVSRPSPELLRLAAIAHAAGIAIMEIYATDFAVQRKADNSVVTEADELAEKIILQHLARNWPQIPVIAEESASRGELPDAGNQFFLVDPLDGTREFLKRNGEFTVNIARIENRVPVTGVIYAPALGRIYSGETAVGAFQADLAIENQPESASWSVMKVESARQGGPIAVASRSHRDAETQALLTRIKPQCLTGIGSSLKFCEIAAGRADVYPRLGRTMEWDTAAGHAILAAAGGFVRSLDGSPLLYGKRDRGFDNPSFIASSTIVNW
jgi:3'(2'), 5'-bisphosphate nucleotidase